MARARGTVCRQGRIRPPLSIIQRRTLNTFLCSIRARNYPLTVHCCGLGVSALSLAYVPSSSIDSTRKRIATSACCDDDLALRPREWASLQMAALLVPNGTVPDGRKASISARTSSVHPSPSSPLSPDSFTSRSARCRP